MNRRNCGGTLDDTPRRTASPPALLVLVLVLGCLATGCASAERRDRTAAYAQCGDIEDAAVQRQCRAEVLEARREEEADTAECRQALAARQDREAAIARANGVEDDAFRPPEPLQQCD